MLSFFILVPLTLFLLSNLFSKTGQKVFRGFFVFFCLTQILLTLWRPIFFWNPARDWVGRFFNFGLTADPLTLVFLLSIGLVVLTAMTVGLACLEEPKQRSHFVHLLMISVIGMNGIVLTADLFSIYVFVEVTAVSLFILMAIQMDKAGLEGSFKYLILSAVATLFMLTGLGIFLLFSSQTSFSALSSALSAATGTVEVKLAMALFLCGVLIKSGIVPFHGWLPDAYSGAPAPVSVLLAGIVTKTTGLYVLLRLVISVFGFQSFATNLFLWGGILSIFAGALAALKQIHLRRMLAYSSISQMGYILLALGSGSPLAIAGAVFHLFNHAVFKSLLFVNAASVEKETGILEFKKLGGLSKKMPVTGFTSVIGFLSTAGIPPLAGFWSKLIIILGVWLTGHTICAGLALLASVLTAAYFLLMQRDVFFGKLKEGFDEVRESNRGLMAVQVILAAICVGAGLFFPYVFTQFILPVQAIL